MAERYAPNPQYTVCTGNGVPLLRKETLKFISEIGEGCFGKVFKGNLIKYKIKYIIILCNYLLRKHIHGVAYLDNLKINYLKKKKKIFLLKSI